MRYHYDARQFLPFEEIMDTLLHELCHIVFGPHDGNFHNLWNELRDEHQTLLMKGYTGEGFLGQGKKLGGQRVPLDEMRRNARKAAEKRHAATKPSNGGHRLGGSRPVQRGVDMRKVIADAASRRISITDGCASGTANAGTLVDQQAQNGFRTTAEQDDANDWAIAQALQDLMYQEEMQRLGAPTGNGGLAWDPENGLSVDNYPAQPPRPPGSSTTQPGGYYDKNGVQLNDERDSAWKSNGKGGYYMPEHPENEPSKKARPIRSMTQTPQERPISRLVTQSSSRPSNPKSSSSSRTPSNFQPHGEDQRRNKSLPPTPLPSSTPDPPLQPLPPSQQNPHIPPPDHWSCPTCTLDNPLAHLACSICTTEQPPQPIPEHRRFASSSSSSSSIPNLPRPPPRTDLRRQGGGEVTTPFEPARGRLGWNCLVCGTFMEREWWTCSCCGSMKAES